MIAYSELVSRIRLKIWNSNPLYCDFKKLGIRYTHMGSDFSSFA
jgi:hypothetical protein